MNFRGFSYGQASVKACELLAQANKTGRWFDLVDQLCELRAIMRRGMGDLVGSMPDPGPVPLPTWAEQNMDLRKARDVMDAAKKAEQQQEQQRQFHQRTTLRDLASEITLREVYSPPRDPRPKRCVAGL